MFVTFPGLFSSVRVCQPLSTVMMIFHGFSWNLSPFDVLVVQHSYRREARPLIAVVVSVAKISFGPPWCGYPQLSCDVL